MHPILSALKHHKTTVALVVMEIALTCAIVSNALFLIGDRLSNMQLSTGVADNELVWVRSDSLREGGTPDAAMSLEQADLAALRGMPGVMAAVRANSLPLLNASMWRSGISVQPGLPKATFNSIAMYLGTPGIVGGLGIRLEQGRDFLPQEYADYSPSANQAPPSAVIITRALAERMWPGQSALGRPIFMGEKGKYVTRVVGVTTRLLNPTLSGRANSEDNLLLPVRSVPGGMYVLRTEPGARDAILRDLPAVLDRVDNDRIITGSDSYARTVSDYFHDDRALIWLLLVVIGCLLALTALGVVGLSSFWVQQRTHQIGIRRAVGATRRDILRYFQTENFLIVSGGIALGLLLAVAMNLLLMKQYELPRLPLAYLPVAALVLWGLGQLAVLGPALRAAAVPPVVATRSV
ncbi:ABC-type antimicrobial peptide transport system, permease component [Rhodanobacter denitrificans]|uniref:ABC-type antimicrobial peptide transport system, permease component n=2 Tax=Rhodanobacter denitrificans TaxID=666685 RepID=M4NDN8_9GAMM|nr:ABC-type antimicrobial peptide transport system, permease component [Rhodanobacter denitrificans]